MFIYRYLKLHTGGR